MAGSTPQFLLPGPLQLLLFGGKGGVGKTTCAVATALYLARQEPNHSFLLVSTDPAHSLLDSLAGAPLPSNLQVQEIDASAAVRRFKVAHGTQLREIAVRGTMLDPEDAAQLLDLSLPGFDEVMAFHEIATLVESGVHRRIIVDTAPTGHTLRLLAMPKSFRTWLQVLDAMLNKHRYLTALYRGATDQDAVEAFLAELTTLIERVSAVLSDPRLCQFVPVLLAERLSINETRRLLRGLRHWNIPFADLVVNRLCPPNPACPCCRTAHRQQQGELARAATWTAPYSLWGITDQGKEVRGAEPVQHYWDDLHPLHNLDAPPTPASASIRQRGAAVASVAAVSSPAPLPPCGVRVMIFAGKGGVGKTTLATATALRLAEERPEAGILLVSTDPAYSLSDCLGLRIGAQETAVRPGLTALEIDARADWKALRRCYAEEIEALFSAGTGLGHISLEYDREVLQRLLDLAPPGLDEIMALTHAVELLESGGHETLVLDTAPTGHLLRLLALPEQARGWLKVLFGIFLKHQLGSRLPRLSAFLVTFSQRLKRLQAILTEPAHGRLYAVTILTEMALENIRDLIAACRSMDLTVAHIFVNRVTPPGDCPLCTARRATETNVQTHLNESLAGYPQSLVYQRGEPRRLKRLTRLGHALYAAPTVPGVASEPVLAGGNHGN